MIKSHLLCSLTFCFLWGASPSFAQEGNAASDYSHLASWTFSESGIEVPAGGLTWQWGSMTIALLDGTLYPVKPFKDGSIPGYRFKGNAIINLGIADSRERDQLARLSGEAITEDFFEESFKDMVFFTSRPFLKTPADKSFGPNYEAFPAVDRIRENFWQWGITDTNARLVQARHIPGDVYHVAHIKSERGWLFFDYDRMRPEELQLKKYQNMNKFTETWVSLDSDRDKQGRPTRVARNIISIPNLDITAEVSGVGSRGQNFYRAKFRVETNVNVFMDGLRVIPLTLSGGFEVTNVSLRGEKLYFIRAERDSDFYPWDNNLLVILKESPAANSTLPLLIEYEGEIRNFVSGRSWYPARDHQNLMDVHTGNIHFKGKGKMRVWASGKLEGRKKNTSVSTWRVTEPTKMMGFSFGTDFKEEKLELEDVPTVKVFGFRGIGFGNQVRNVGADIINSLKFYQWYFDAPITAPELMAARIESGHGQAFEGYLHLSGFTFQNDSPGASELFRAHEVAHQYWGHMVSWHSYRDQWLSEALAEYSAMMFIEATMPDEDYFEDILKAYNGSLLGDLSFSKFARFDAVRMTEEHKARLGPIGMGFRASTAEMPRGYVLQTYTKGAMVVHSMRKLMERTSKDPDIFQKFLREFIKVANGKFASTQDFKAVAENMTGQDWTWFFDQWIHDTYLPTIKVDYEIPSKPKDDGKYHVVLKVRQENMKPGFVSFLPVDVFYSELRKGKVMVRLDKEEMEQVIPVSQKPKKLVFNSDYSFLGDIKK